MPFEVPATSGIEGEDLFPADEDDQKKILAWVERNYTMARDAKVNHQEQWNKYYKMYRSYVKKKSKGDWRSREWIPIAFYVIETIVPRLVAQLPEFTVNPVGPEDAAGAELMEELLKWSTDQSDLYLELTKALKSSLLYGTGILKTMYDEKMAYQISREPEMVESTADYPTGELDLDGNPITQTVSMGAVPTGKMLPVRRSYKKYAGPIAEAVDITNFFVDPIADSIDSARFVIHRVYRDRSHLEDMFAQGVYHRPEREIWDTFITEHSTLARQGLIELGPGASLPDDGSLVELLELWTDGTVVTTAGSNGSGPSLLLRVEKNPYAHGEKPFVRIVDHLVPHEFWGVGELEPLEGIQNTINELWNSRIDNVKLVLNTMFLASMDYIVDPSDLKVKPAGVVRVREGVPLDQAVQPLELGEVTGSSYTEVSELERMSEKVSGVSAYTAGTDSSSLNRTATGVALISESGNTRFAHKVRIAELTGFKHLARHYATILQQFSDDQITVRILGDAGAIFKQIPADAIGGRYDYDVEAESSTQTESIRKEQTLSLFQMLAADPYMKPLKMRADVLKVFGRKNVQDYMLSEQELQMMMQQQAQAQAAAPPPEG